MIKKIISSILIGAMLATSSVATIARADGPVYDESAETPYDKAEDEAVNALTNTYLDLKSVDQEVITENMSKETANPIINLAHKIINKMKEILEALKQAFKDTFYSDKGTITVKYMHNGKEIAKADVYNDLKLGEYTYTPVEVEGYFCGVEEQTVEITKENPVATCTFEYETNASKLPKQITIMYKTVELDKDGNIVKGSEKDILNEEGQPYTKVFTEENSPLGQGANEMKAEAMDFPQYDVYGATEMNLSISKDAPQAVGTFYYTQAHGNVKIVSFCVDEETEKEITEEIQYNDLLAGSIYRYTPEAIGNYEPKDPSELEIKVVKNTTTEVKVEYVAKQTEGPTEPENPDKPTEPEKPENPDQPEQPEKIVGTLNLLCVDEDGNELSNATTELTKVGTYKATAPDFSANGYVLMAGENAEKNYDFNENGQVINVRFTYVLKNANKNAVNTELKKADALMDEVLRYMNNREDKNGIVTVAHKKADGTLLEKSIHKNLTIDDFTFEAKVDAFAKKNVTKLVKVVVDGEEKELSEEVVVSITADKTEHTVEFIYE